MPEDHGAKVFMARLCESLKKIGRPPYVDGESLKRNLEMAGFCDVQVHAYKQPFGPWPKDKRLKNIGAMGILSAETGMLISFFPREVLYVANLLGCALKGSMRMECSYLRRYLKCQRPRPRRRAMMPSRRRRIRITTCITTCVHSSISKKRFELISFSFVCGRKPESV